MTSPMPAHISAAIQQRITVLREVWRADEEYRHPPHTRRATPPVPRPRLEPFGRPGSTSPTFPGPHRDDVRSAS
jgi:hypothetical protein